MVEYVKFNCHLMARNEVNQTPEQLMEKYNMEKKSKGFNYTFDGVECVVSSCSYAQGKHSIITKIIRKDSNDIVCSEQKGKA